MMPELLQYSFIEDICVSPTFHNMVCITLHIVGTYFVRLFCEVVLPKG